MPRLLYSCFLSSCCTLDDSASERQVEGEDVGGEDDGEGEQEYVSDAGERKKISSIKLLKSAKEKDKFRRYE